MTDLRPCPFCGSDACYVDEDGSALLEPTLDASCGSTRCMPPSSYVPASSWQARPIEDALLNRALTAEARVAQLERAIAADPLESERLRALIAEALDLLRAGVDPGEYAQSVWVSQIVATLMEADNGSPRPTPPEP